MTMTVTWGSGCWCRCHGPIAMVVAVVDSGSRNLLDHETIMYCNLQLLLENKPPLLLFLSLLLLPPLPCRRATSTYRWINNVLQNGPPVVQSRLVGWEKKDQEELYELPLWCRASGSSHLDALWPVSAVALHWSRAAHEQATKEKTRQSEGNTIDAHNKRMNMDGILFWLSHFSYVAYCSWVGASTSLHDPEQQRPWWLFIIIIIIIIIATPPRCKRLVRNDNRGRAKKKTDSYYSTCHFLHTFSQNAVIAEQQPPHLLPLRKLLESC